MVSASDLNPVSNFEFGTLGFGLLIFVIALLVVGGIGFVVYLYVKKKELKHTIVLYKKVGGRTKKVDTVKAKDFKVGLAGDLLWFIPKYKKYISMATIQSGDNEYLHFIREDGEWINFEMGDIDEQMKLAGAKYIHSDMKSTRIAIGNILDNRFKGKQSWWDKYGQMVTMVIFYLVVAIALVVIFYQWGDIIDRTTILLDKIIGYEQLKCATVDKGIVPAMLLMSFRRKK